MLSSCRSVCKSFRSSRFDSNRPLCSRFDLLDSRFARHLEKITQEGEQGG